MIKNDVGIAKLAGGPNPERPQSRGHLEDREEVDGLDP